MDPRLHRGLVEFRGVLAVPAGVPVSVSENVPTWRRQDPTLHELTAWQVLGHRRREPRPKPRLVRAFYMLNGGVHVSPENFKLIEAAFPKVTRG